MFGVKLPVNFLSPYRARNIAEFWQTWHATLSRFLRDYVYAALGDTEYGRDRQRLRLFATMFVGGVWHGAGWTFVVFGICHGVYMLVHQLWRTKVSVPMNLVRNARYQFGAQAFTFLLVVVSLVFFRAESLETAWSIFGQLANIQGGGLSKAYADSLVSSNPTKMSGMLPIHLSTAGVIYGLLTLALLVCWCLPNTQQLFAPYDVASHGLHGGRRSVLDMVWNANGRWALFTASLLIISLLNLAQVSEFLYFQF